MIFFIYLIVYFEQIRQKGLYDSEEILIKLDRIELLRTAADFPPNLNIKNKEWIKKAASVLYVHYSRLWTTHYSEENQQLASKYGKIAEMVKPPSNNHSNSKSSKPSSDSSSSSSWSYYVAVSGVLLLGVFALTSFFRSRKNDSSNSPFDLNSKKKKRASRKLPF